MSPDTEDEMEARLLALVAAWLPPGATCGGCAAFRVCAEDDWVQPYRTICLHSPNQFRAKSA
jgi:hypothetical protein